MNYYLAKYGYSKASYLAHHGILGMRWGIRRFQNKDGSLTKAGKERYSDKSIDDKRNSKNDSPYKQEFHKVFDKYHRTLPDGSTYLDLTDVPKNERKPMKDAWAREHELRSEYRKMRNNAKTDEEKDAKVRAWDRANDEDLYEMNFLESIQNSKMLREHDTVGMLTEYAKYLDDRMDYMENQGWKLK